MLLIGYSDQLVRMAIMKANKFTCQYCRQKFEENFLAVDHIDPRCKDGKDELENYTLACSLCNNRKNGTSLEEPGRSLLLTLAKRKKSRILRLLQQAKPCWKEKNRPSMAEEIIPGFGKLKTENYWLDYPLPINQCSIRLLLFIVSHSGIEKRDNEGKYLLVRLNESNFCQIRIAQNLTTDQFREALRWLTSLNVSSGGFHGNVVGGWEEYHRNNAVIAMDVFFSDRAYEVSKYINQLAN
jgi:hypothetical protein